MTAKVINPLRLEPMPLVPRSWLQRAWDRARFWRCTSRSFRLIEDYIAELLNGDMLLVPAGTIIDGASIPPSLWWYLGHPLDIFLAWAGVHDPAYAGTLIWKDRYGVNKNYTRRDADLLVFEFSDPLVIPMRKQRAAYFGVRAGAVLAWRKGHAA